MWMLIPLEGAQPVEEGAADGAEARPQDGDGRLSDRHLMRGECRMNVCILCHDLMETYAYRTASSIPFDA